jgi:transposase
LSDDVMIAVDPHKASNTAAVLDPVTKTVIEAARFANTADGYGQLARFAARWEQRRWAVEGCHGAGRFLAQRLVADGEAVLDVPAKLAARVRMYSRGDGRKTGKDDAVSVGLAALDGTGITPAARDGALVSLRLLCDRREELTAQRTQAVCRLHRLIAELTPGGMRRELSANKAQALLARIRPAGDVAGVRVQIARDHLADIRALDARIKYLGAQIAALVTASGTGLTRLYGIGPVIAGRIVAEVGDVARFATKDTFASYNGTAPIGVSSGDQIRHRLSRAGNRRINHALHMMAVTQIRNRGSQGRAYFDKKMAEGKTRKEALRALKRRISDAIFARLQADAWQATAHAKGPEGQQGNALSPARPAHTPGTGSSAKPLPGLTHTTTPASAQRAKATTRKPRRTP